jgi:hypothetical protein
MGLPAHPGTRVTAPAARPTRRSEATSARAGSDSARNRIHGTLLAATCAALCSLAAPASAQDPHLLVVVGVGGSPEHTEKFHKWGTSVAEAAATRGIPAANIVYLADRPEQAPSRIQARSTRENVTRALTELATRAKPDDEVFVLLLGHGSYDGRQAAFNLPGPDLTAEDYKLLLDKFPTQRVIFVNTSSSSGAFVPVLAGPARTIVAATKTGGERNETRFPEFFVEALTTDVADRDRNGRISVLEAFDYSRTKVEATYQQTGHLLTEHATLDDGMEGKLAGMQFLAPTQARSAELASASPALRGLLQERDALEREIAELRLRKDSMEAVRYEQELERLLTDLALKTRSIRELEAKE